MQNNDDGTPSFRVLPTKVFNGYERVYLPSQYYSVHRLVALAFHDKPVGKNVVHHINNDSTDNRAENLAWTTSSDNTKRAHKDGLCRGTYKDDNVLVDALIEYWTTNQSIRATADHYDLSPSVLYRCGAGKMRIEALKMAKRRFRSEYGPLSERQIQRQTQHATSYLVSAMVDYLTTDKSQEDIANEYGLSTSHVSRIYQGRQRPEVIQQAKMKAG